MKNYEETIENLQKGKTRAAYYSETNGWQTDTNVKEAILKAFKNGENVNYEGQYHGFVDKNTIPPQQFTTKDGLRMVPGGSSVRKGAYVASGVIIMPPSYINAGAHIASGSMVDSHVLVGTCAQVGHNVHLSAGVQIGGVLEPIGAYPVIIENNVFVGAGSIIVEGLLIKQNAVIAPGVSLSKSVKLYDCVNEQELDIKNGIPQNAVVVPGTRPVSSQWGQENGLQINCALIVKYRDDKSDQSLALEEALR